MKNRNKKTIMSIALAAAMVSSMVATTGFSVYAEGEEPTTVTTGDETPEMDLDSGETETEGSETEGTETEGTEAEGSESTETEDTEAEGSETEGEGFDEETEGGETDGTETEGEETEDAETGDTETEEDTEDTESNENTGDEEVEDEPVVDEKPSGSTEIGTVTSATSSLTASPVAEKFSFTDNSGNKTTGTLVAFSKSIENAKVNADFTINAGNCELVFKTNFMEKLIAKKATLNVTYKNVQFVIKGAEFSTVKVINLEKIFRSAECQKLLKNSEVVYISTDADGELVLSAK